MIGNYTAYHVHSDYSLLDSATNYKDYIDKAVALGQTAIAFSEHGNTKGWVKKKLACDAAGIKYIHACEVYLTRSLLQNVNGEQKKVRDNYHTVLIAKNFAGLLELNRLVSISTDESHNYYDGRISFEEFVNTSRNIIATSACLASPLNKLDVSDPWYERLVRRYDYLEIQPHNCQDQINFNRHLAELSVRYGVPLIAGTDAHSVDKYKSECRDVLMSYKGQYYDGEEDMDLTYKSYDELCKAFEKQDALPKDLYMQAIENTNRMANSVESFELDRSNKYPILYGSAEKDTEVFVKNVWDSLDEKVANGVIPISQKESFASALNTEIETFKKIGMCGFMQSMSEFIRWCHNNGIVTGFCRGSVGGSRAAYVTDTIDLNSEVWNTVFSRFANEDRTELGDIDIDVIDTDRPKIFEYIINRFGTEKTARVPSYGTAQGNKAIEIIVGAMHKDWCRNNPTKDKKDTPYSVEFSKQMKSEYEKNPDEFCENHKDIAYYLNGLLDVKVSQSFHPAGIIVSPVNLAENYGTFMRDKEIVLQIDMDEAHDVGLVKYDMLILRNIGIIKDTCEMAGIKYPKSHELDWYDKEVWDDMIRSPVGIFEFEGDFAFKLLKDFKPQSIFDMSLVTACIRPSGASYRNDLIARKSHSNPSSMIDELLKDNLGYLVYQEDVIKFLQQICGLSGSEADTVRRGIAKKKMEILDGMLPKIINGYCEKSDKPREEAEEEVKEYLKVIEDASSYMFNYSHSVAYCMIGYLCAYLRKYYPFEFVTALFNRAANDEDVTNATHLANELGIEIIKPKFGVSKGDYFFDRKQKVIAKGIASVKHLNGSVADELYNMSQAKQYTYFMDFLLDAEYLTFDSRKRDILVKIGYFSDFGTVKELLRLIDIYNFFHKSSGKGMKTSVKKSEISENMYSLISPYITDVLKSGRTSASSYQIIDIVGLLHTLEDYIKSLDIGDVDYKTHMDNQKEYLGYIDMTTGKAEDRRKLIILEVFPLSKEKHIPPWGYAVKTQSIGSGKTARLTIQSEIFEHKPLKEYDVVRANHVYQNKKGFWYMDYYTKITANNI